MKTERGNIVSNISFWLLFSLLGLLSGCEVFDYHPYDARVDGHGDHNARNATLIAERCAGRDTVRFAVISDTQRWYDETARLVSAVNGRGDVDFVIHCGDQTDFGLTKEWEWMGRELRRLQMPYVCLIGNHDCLGTGGDVYRALYGNPNFSFNVADTHIVCLNTNAYEYDYSTAIPDFSFIREDRAAVPAGVSRTIVAMHAAPYTDQFNNNVAEVFEGELRRYPGLLCCLCGHTHHTKQEIPFHDGIVYYTCGSAQQRCYLLFTLMKDSLAYEEVVC